MHSSFYHRSMVEKTMHCGLQRDKLSSWTLRYYTCALFTGKTRNIKIWFECIQIVQILHMSCVFLHHLRPMLTYSGDDFCSTQITKATQNITNCFNFWTEYQFLIPLFQEAGSINLLWFLLILIQTQLEF